MGLKLNATNGGGSVELDVPDTVNSDLALTVPATAGEIAVVATDGSVDLGDVSIDSSGRVGVGTSSPSVELSIAGSNPQLVLWEGTDGASSSKVQLGTGTVQGFINIHKGDGTRTVQLSSDGDTFFTGGDLLLGKTVNDTTIDGIALEERGLVQSTRTNSFSAIFNRESDDGQIILIRQDNITEGSISVSGSTVSYNGAHLSRWSQLASGAARTEILRGSVLSNLDEMCEWAYDAEPEVLWAEGDELPEGVSVGDVKTPARDAGTEENEQLNRMKVSDVEGDVNVSGVFQAWDDDDDTYTNDFYCAMTGDFVIRIAQGTTVARGDLLMSAGDGTAKPQGDDIVRSKTIAKVTSTTVSTTYSDGSYCVPCVLMAC